MDTDKNLGPALVTTDWLKTETLRQLNDRQSYSIISNEEWIVKHSQVICTREKLMSTFSRFIIPNAAKFLRSYDHLLCLTKLSSTLYLRYTKPLWWVGRLQHHIVTSQDL